ncbi:hypothetical protein KGM_204453 [Danaus plexippus plexippus]|uniref:Uncharacterized protein n=1 Tax=Danaus plexippus plexippus TaxID=278856 RepID=A0A212EUV5_DANPL|nr:hypothetical protein KGM_204453 [Danaus plexippus plexippus]
MRIFSKTEHGQVSQTQALGPGLSRSSRVDSWNTPCFNPLRPLMPLYSLCLQDNLQSPDQICCITDAVAVNSLFKRGELARWRRKCLQTFVRSPRESLQDTEGVSSGCEASGFKDEIARDYAALQTRLGREFSDRRGKLYAAIRPVATEEQLSADFRKKLAEWQRMKGVRQPPPVPARQDLSEDFLKKWDEWKRMKETNSVPAWKEEEKPDEVLVQTSTGLFKFHGISRSFTRKLHEWEKSRGIAPEASTSALLRAARAKVTLPALTRTQSDGSVAPSNSGRVHASSLSVNDVDDFDSEYERDHSLHCTDYDNTPAREAVLVEVEAEEICTAAPLVAVSPRHTPQKPIYTYGRAEARHLCETSSAVTGTAVLQSNGAVVFSESPNLKQSPSKEYSSMKIKTSRDQLIIQEKSHKSKIIRQASIEEDAKFIRKTIEEIERGSSNRYKQETVITVDETNLLKDAATPSTSRICSLRTIKQDNLKDFKNEKDSNEEAKEESKRKEADKSNGKKKSKSRARLEREQSKPSESDTEPEVDTVTVEIPRRRKRPRRPSEKPRTPPASLHSDSDGEVFVLKLKTPDQRDICPEVIVKTTRKIFSPVVRSGESVPRAVIPVDVEDLDEVRSPGPSKNKSESRSPSDQKLNVETKVSRKSKKPLHLQEEEQRPRSRPPLPLSPPSQRKPPPKETSPSIRIMIQRYNKKINEEGPLSGASSGASSPAWRSPKSERRRPPDMPIGVNIRNNPFLEREVQKSASACQLTRRDQTSAEKSLSPTCQTHEGVLKSHSANTLHPEKSGSEEVPTNIEDSQETIRNTTTSSDTIVPNKAANIATSEGNTEIEVAVSRKQSESVLPCISRFVAQNPCYFERSLSTVETSSPSREAEELVARLSERAERIRVARERFLSSTSPMRREGTSSASDLRPADRSSRMSEGSNVESQPPAELGRSASTGMVNVERETWQRIAEAPRRERPKSRFSLSRLAAKLRRKEESAVSRLCRQSLLVQLRKQ